MMPRSGPARECRQINRNLRINIKYIQRIKTSERFKYKASKAFK